MTRPIKFRGKYLHDESGEPRWVYGDLIQRKKEFLIQTQIVGYVVDQKSVGQFTGLLDKNGVEIYEGDVLKPMFLEGVSVVAWNEQEAGWYLDAISVRDGYEIIGNIYENPELLK